MRRNEIASSSRNPERNRKSQSDATSSKIDVCRQMSKSESLREAQVGGVSNEQQTERKDQNEILKRMIEDLPHEVQHVILTKDAKWILEKMFERLSHEKDGPERAKRVNCIRIIHKATYYKEHSK